ncbi:acyl-CoA N-acyltransferase [Phycomyces nitens]|nr:acyl-CoA N-acyltransferase [Phycomyces nitens]
MSTIEIRPATPADAGLIVKFIKDLAEYEKLAHEAVVTEELILKNLFGERPYAEVIFAYCAKTPGEEKVPAGMALFFHNFSTFLGKPGLYLEDLFVKPEFRGLGVGKRLLVQLAALAKERDCGRYEWVVIDWNEPSRKFYEALGAVPHQEWIIHRVEGKSLDDLAAM